MGGLRDVIDEEGFEKAKKVAQAMLDVTRGVTKGDGLTNMEGLFATAMVASLYMYDCPEEQSDDLMELYKKLVRTSIKITKREKESEASPFVN